jgi:DNA mismatch repair protein MutS
MGNRQHLALDSSPATLWPPSCHAGDGHSFESVLSARTENGTEPPRPQPDFFRDLNLDQVLEALLAGREEYDLAPFFHRALHDPDEVAYRHGVMRDLERAEVAAAVRAFAGQMVEMRKQLQLVEKLRHVQQKRRWFLSAIHVYCDAVTKFNGELRHAAPASRGLAGLSRYLAAYARSEPFTCLREETAEVEQALAEIDYAIHLKGMRVTVGRYEEEPDLTSAIEETFSRFRQGQTKDYRVGFRDMADANHVEGRILDFVAEIHPDAFSRLAEHCQHHEAYLDSTIARFDREIQFYLAYIEFTAPLKEEGLSFCYPAVSDRSKTIRAKNSFDLALARKLRGHDQPIVVNDVELTGAERVIVVTGPNQGGKTTFARMFGQLHHLGALGLPVPGTEARLFLPDRIFAHFEREEDLQTLRGKFEDELVRLHEILELATSDSLLIMNESFTSTTLDDALHVGTRVLEQIIDRDILCLCVTFVDELAALADSTVSMMSTVSPEDPAIRTFKVIRNPADGRAYALALADKHGVSFERLKERIAK